MPYSATLLLPGITQPGQTFFETDTGLNEMIEIITNLTSLRLAGCDAATTDTHGANPEEQAMGERVFQENCQECHEIKASGVVREWQKRLPDGSMPPYRDTFSQDENIAVLTYIKSLWPDDLYAARREQNGE